MSLPNFTIYKFPMAPKIAMPEGAEILHVGAQGSEAMIWAKVDLSRPMITREFSIYGTGFEIKSEDNLKHLGTAVLPSGLVWHIFEKVD